MHADLTQLKNFLIDSGLISIKDLNAVIEAVGENEKKMEDTLIAKGLISEDELKGSYPAPLYCDLWYNLYDLRKFRFFLSYLT